MKRLPRIARAALCLAAGLLASPAAAQQDLPAAAVTPVWNLVTADLRTEPIFLKSFGESGLKVSPAAGGADRDVPAAQLIELSRQLPAVNSTAKFDLHLVGGDRVHGEPIRIVDDEDLLWLNPVVGEVRFPLRLITGLTPLGGNISGDRRKTDIITLTNRDQITGTITEITPAQVSILEGNRTIPIEFARVASISLAPTAAGGKDKPFFRVKLDEGSVIFAPTLQLAGDALSFKAGGEARTVPLARVTQVEQMNGPVSFLANRAPVSNVYVPFYGTSQRFVARMHTGFEGEPIRFRDRPFPRSIAAHSLSRISWPLDGSYAAFRTRYALDPKNPGGSGDVTVRIKLDDKVVHEVANFRSSGVAAPVVIELGSARTLTLEVDYGRRIDAGDRFLWLEPALLREKPAPAPAVP